MGEALSVPGHSAGDRNEERQRQDGVDGSHLIVEGVVLTFEESQSKITDIRPKKRRALVE